MELVFKGKSRCFVFHEEHIEKVEQIIKELDDFEYCYMPKNWVSLPDKYWDNLVYNGKFDINIPILVEACANEKIGIIVRSSNIDNEIF